MIQQGESLPDPNQELRELVTSIARSVQANSAAIAELREGQQMMMQIFRERDTRLEQAIQAFERRTEAFQQQIEAFQQQTEVFQQQMQSMGQEIADLRRDFLEFLMRGDRRSDEA